MPSLLTGWRCRWFSAWLVIIRTSNEFNGCSAQHQPMGKGRGEPAGAGIINVLKNGQQAGWVSLREAAREGMVTMSSDEILKTWSTYFKLALPCTEIGGGE